MTNHAHPLMTPSTPVRVSRVLQDLSRDFVRSINRTYRRTGTFWEGRLQSSSVDTSRYCLTCYRHEVGKALSVRLGQGKRGRPKKIHD